MHTPALGYAMLLLRMEHRPTSSLRLRYLPRDVVKNLFVDAQLGHQTLQVAVFLLQTLQPLGLVSPRTAVFLLPAVEDLFGDSCFPANRRMRFPICARHFNLPKYVQDPLRTVLRRLSRPGPSTHTNVSPHGTEFDDHSRPDSQSRYFCLTAVYLFPIISF